jgi:nitrogenase subunit NifH
MGLSRGGPNPDFMIEKDSIGFGYGVKLAMQIIAIADQKCGVGKTTSTINIGAGLNQLGKRVTIFDYKPDSPGGEDYLALCREIVGRGRRKMKKILLIIIYLSDMVKEAIRDLVKKYRARTTARQ